MNYLFQMGLGPQLQNYRGVVDKVLGVIIPRKLKKNKKIGEPIQVMLEIAQCICLPMVIRSDEGPADLTDF